MEWRNILQTIKWKAYWIGHILYRIKHISDGNIEGRREMTGWRGRRRRELSYRFTDSSQAVSKPVWQIPLLRVQWKTADDGQTNCPKHVGFYSKNKFEKSVHLVGFIIRIYNDARSPERQRLGLTYTLRWRPILSPKSFALFLFVTFNTPEWGGWYSNSLQAGQSGDHIPMVARFSMPFQIGPGAHPASCTMGTWSLSWG